MINAASAATMNKDVGAKTHSSHRAMVTDSMSKLGYTSVIFVDPGVRVVETYYCDLLLSQQLLPELSRVSGEYFSKTPAY